MVDTPFGSPSDAVVRGKLGDTHAALPAAPRPGPSHPAAQDQLPGEHLRPEEARRQPGDKPLGGRLDEGRDRARRRGHRRPVHRPDQAPASAPSSTRTSPPTSRFSDPVCASLAEAAARAAGSRGRQDAPRRHLRVHGRAAVFHARREPALPELGCFGDRHDFNAGGQAGAGGRDALRHHGACNRLRLLARNRRGRLGGRRARCPAPQRRAGEDAWWQSWPPTSPIRP